MPFDTDAKQEPSSVTQLAQRCVRSGSTAALTPQRSTPRRPCGWEVRTFYRVRLANALLGAAQTEALLADAIPLSPDARAAAYEQQISTAGGADDPAKRIAFLRWQTLRVRGPLREIAQNVGAGPVPLAAAHAADGLQKLLGVIAASQNPTPDDADRLAGPVTDELRAAREALSNAIGNVDILLELLDVVL